MSCLFSQVTMGRRQSRQQQRLERVPCDHFLSSETAIVLLFICFCFVPHGAFIQKNRHLSFTVYTLSHSLLCWWSYTYIWWFHHLIVIHKTHRITAIVFVNLFITVLSLPHWLIYARGGSGLPVTHAASASQKITCNILNKNLKEWPPCLPHKQKHSNRVKDLEDSEQNLPKRYIKRKKMQSSIVDVYSVLYTANFT